LRGSPSRTPSRPDSVPSAGVSGQVNPAGTPVILDEPQHWSPDVNSAAALDPNAGFRDSAPEVTVAGLPLPGTPFSPTSLAGQENAGVAVRGLASRDANYCNVPGLKSDVSELKSKIGRNAGSATVKIGTARATPAKASPGGGHAISTAPAFVPAVSALDTSLARRSGRSVMSLAAAAEASGAPTAPSSALSGVFAVAAESSSTSDPSPAIPAAIHPVAALARTYASPATPVAAVPLNVLAHTSTETAASKAAPSLSSGQTIQAPTTPSSNLSAPGSTGSNDAAAVFQKIAKATTPQGLRMRETLAAVTAVAPVVKPGPTIRPSAALSCDQSTALADQSAAPASAVSNAAATFQSIARTTNRQVLRPWETLATAATSALSGSTLSGSTSKAPGAPSTNQPAGLSSDQSAVPASADGKDAAVTSIPQALHLWETLAEVAAGAPSAGLGKPTQPSAGLSPNPPAAPFSTGINGAAAEFPSTAPAANLEVLHLWETLATAARSVSSGPTSKALKASGALSTNQSTVLASDQPTVPTGAGSKDTAATSQGTAQATNPQALHLWETLAAAATITPSAGPGQTIKASTVLSTNHSVAPTSDQAALSSTPTPNHAVAPANSDGNNADASFQTTQQAANFDAFNPWETLTEGGALGNHPVQRRATDAVARPTNARVGGTSASADNSAAMRANSSTSATSSSDHDPAVSFASALHAQASSLQPGVPQPITPSATTAAAPEASSASAVPPPPPQNSAPTPAPSPHPQSGASADPSDASNPSDPSRMVQSGQLRVHENSSELKISVQLPELGKIEVRAVSAHDVTTAHLTTTQHGALQVLGADRATLEQALKSHDVILGSMDLNARGQSGGGQRQTGTPVPIPSSRETPSMFASIPSEEGGATGFLPDYSSLSVRA